MSLILDEKRKSLSNSRSNILEAKVIANYGDPGLDENYHFDILSKYIIVMIESSYRIPTTNKWNKLFAVVSRPNHLWINVEEGKSDSPNSQKRSDASGNVSVGLSENFSVAGIPRINYPYQIGELIKIKKLANPLKLGRDNIFISQFNESNQPNYQQWHTEGSSLSYFAGQQQKIDALKLKTLSQINGDNLFQYAMSLNKYQYEAFILGITNGDNSLTDYIVSIFGNTISNTSSVYLAHGGYLFKNANYINFTAVEYEDINIGNKQRVNSNECVPLIVTTPNTFPTPKTRTPSLITYNPTYVIKS